LPCTACSNTDKSEVNFEGLLNGYTYRISTYLKCNSASSDVNFYFGCNFFKSLNWVKFTTLSAASQDIFVYNQAPIKFGEQSHELDGNK